MMSTMSALTGTVIGGVTTFASSWLTSATQFRVQRSAEQKGKREDLYGRFLDEAMRLTLLAGEAGPDEFVVIRSMHMRILLVGNDEVVTLGERVIAGLENAVTSPPSDAGKAVNARA